MNKYVKRTLFITAAYMIISIVNTALFTVEFMNAMAPGVLVPSFDNMELVRIALGINIVFSIASNTFVGRKAPAAGSTTFDLLILLLPLTLGITELIIVKHNIFSIAYPAFFFTTTLGITVLSFSSIPMIGYIIAAIPTALMIIGYASRR